jgi:hypothetical protein
MTSSWWLATKVSISKDAAARPPPQNDGSSERMLVAATRSEKCWSRRQSLLRSRSRHSVTRFGGYLECWSCEGQRFASFPLLCLRSARAAKETDPWPSSRGRERKTHRLEKGLHVAKHCLPVRQDVATLWLKYGVGLRNRPDPG